jgi:hypothetical protein
MRYLAAARLGHADAIGDYLETTRAPRPIPSKRRAAERTEIRGCRIANLRDVPARSSRYLAAPLTMLQSFDTIPR